MQNWIPLNDRLLVRRIPNAPEIGLVRLPDIAQGKSHRGIVVAVGPGKYIEVGDGLMRRAMEVKAGDIIHFSLLDWESFDELHVIIQEGDVFFVERVN